MTANINQPAFVVQGPTVNITPTATSATVRVRAAGVTGQARHVRIWNSSASIAAFVENAPTSTTVASLTASTPIPPGGSSGQIQIISLQGDWVAVVSSTAGGVVYFTPGEGL